MAGQGGAAAIGIGLGLLWGTALLGYLVLSDIRSRRLPNLGVLLLAAAYLPCWWLQGADVTGLLSHGATAMAGLLLFAWFHARGWLAGGDVKLAAAVLLWAGPVHGLTAMAVTALAGMVVALAQLAVTPRLAPSSVWHASRGTPYGVALALGGLWAIWRPAVGEGTFF